MDTKKTNPPGRTFSRESGQAGGLTTTITPTASKYNTTLIRARIKAVIVRLALVGIVPAAVAEWLIGQGGLRHE